MLGRDYYHRSEKQSCRNQLRSHLFRHKLATLCYVYRNDKSITSSILSLITHWITFPSPTPRMRSQVLWALEILSMAAWRELSNWRMSRRRYCGEKGEKKLTSYVRWLTRPSVFNSPWMVFQILTLCQRNHLGKSPQSLRWPSSVMRCLEINGSG